MLMKQAKVKTYDPRLMCSGEPYPYESLDDDIRRPVAGVL